MSAFVDAPSDWYFQKTVSATPYNAVRALIGATAFGAYRYYEFCDLVYCEFLSGNFTGASTTPIRDSISLLSDIEGYGFYGRAWLILTGMVAIEATVMGGPSGVPLGATYTWNAQTSGDTAGYMYKWFADGQEVSGAVGNRYSRYFSTSGSHPLRVIATRSDYTADTADKTVSVYSFSASINGPTSGVTTASNCQVTYYASVSGGVGGLSYQWNVDSGVMITENYGSSIVVRMVAQGERSISVTVTDGNGNQTGAGIQVQVGQYDDSNCGLG